MRARLAFLGLVALPLAACSTLETLPVVSALPSFPVPDALRMETVVDKPATLLERALSGCGARTEAGETACIKAALASDGLSVPALAGMIHGCSPGRMCHLTYTTEELVGLTRAAASRFLVHWRVDVDLTHPAATVDAVPITVVQV